MRYYRIEVLNADGSPFIVGGQLTPKGPAVWTTQGADGKFDPGYPRVEFDIQVSTLGNPIGYPHLKIWGVGLDILAQQSDFNGKLINVYAGMQPGLPLATAAYQNKQQGLILQGTIWQAFGNWIGTAQTLEFYVNFTGQDLDKQLNLTLTWEKGQTLADALTKALNVGFPGYTVDIQINSKLVFPDTDAHSTSSVISFSQYVKQASAALLNPNQDPAGYQGVDIRITGKKIIVRDGSAQSAPTQLIFNDLIGQPTWLDPGTLQVTTVMRADVQPFSYVLMPPANVTQTQQTQTVASLPAFRDKSVFQGTFYIKEMRHIGDSRSPDALSWVTIINCVPLTPSSIGSPSG